MRQSLVGFLAVFGCTSAHTCDSPNAVDRISVGDTVESVNQKIEIWELQQPLWAMGHAILPNETAKEFHSRIDTIKRQDAFADHPFYYLKKESLAVELRAKDGILVAINKITIRGKYAGNKSVDRG